MTSDPRLDRVPFFDERSKGYPIRMLLPDKPIRSYSWQYVQLDQGNEGACTGFSVTTEAAARPDPVFGDPVRKPPKAADVDAIAREVYERAKQLDEFPGEDYEGSTVLAATKAAVERGWYTEYRWALGPGPDAAADDVCRAIAFHGPVCLGTVWKSGMWKADANGYLHATGTNEGGHAWCVTKYSKVRDAIWTPNSWGGAGQGWITRKDLTTLLAEDGEAVILVRHKR